MGRNEGEAELGNKVGPSEGRSVGYWEGVVEGVFEGEIDGGHVGDAEGAMLGHVDGRPEVGAKLGDDVGRTEGTTYWYVNPVEATGQNVDPQNTRSPVGFTPPTE